MAERMCVLVVDDDAEIREALYEGLAQKGYRVLVASNGEQALSLLQSQRAEHGKAEVDVVVTDWMMRGGDGIELLGKLRKDHFEAMPLVLVSGAVDSEMLQFAKQLDADVVLPKPFQIEGLCDKIEQAIRLRRAKSEASKNR